MWAGPFLQKPLQISCCVIQIAMFQNQPDIEQMKCTQVKPPCTFLYFSVMLLLQKNDNARWYSSSLHPTQRQLLKFAAIFMRKDMEEKTLYNFQIFLLHLLYNIFVGFFQLKPNHLLFFLFLLDSLILGKKNHFIPANVAEAFVSLNIILKI